MPAHAESEAITEKTALLSPPVKTSSDIAGKDEESQTSSSADASQDSELQDFKITRLSSRGKYTIFILALANLFSGAGFSVIAPFFPMEAEKKGVSSVVTGLIFSIFELAQIISAPIFGNYLSRVGAKFMFLSGVFIGGSCAILFGTLNRCPPGTAFIVMCFLVRTVEALGVTAYMTASFAIVSNEFPKHVATVFGTIETAYGIGLMIGPAIGGLLYEAGGYGFPFYIIGSLILLNGIIVFRFLPTPKQMENKRKRSMFLLLRSPMVLVTIFTIMTGTIGISFLDPTLSKHLEKFNLSPSLVGLVFIIPPGLYAFTAPLWGYLGDVKNIPEVLMVIGNLVVGVGYLVVGPSPLLPFLPYELWTVILGLVIFGLCIGCNIVPTMKCILNGAKEVGFEENLDTYGIVSGLFNAVLGLGSFLGPTIGGAMVEKFGFDWASTVVSGVAFFSMILTLIYFSLRQLKHRSHEPVHHSRHDKDDVQLFENSLSSSVSSNVSLTTSHERKMRHPSFLRSLSHQSS